MKTTTRTKQKLLKVFAMCILFLGNSHLMAQTPTDASLFQTVCAGSTEPYVIQSISTTSTFTWSLDNGTTFGTITSGQFTDSISIIWGSTTGTDTLRMYETNNGCEATVVTLAITIVESPTADAGLNASICEGDSYTLSATDQNAISGSWSGGLGSFTPNNLDPNATYIPDITEYGTSVDLTWTAIGSSAPSSDCYDHSSTMTLTINLSTTSTSIQTACDSLIWNGVTYFASGIYDTTFAGGNSNSCDSTATLDLTIIQSPDPFAGPNDTICEGLDFTISGATVSNTTGFSWTSTGSGSIINATTLAPTYMPSVGEVGSVTLTLTATGNSPCNNVSDDMIIIINPIPTPGPIFHN